MTIPIELSEDTFAALFRPKVNHLNPHATCDWGNGYGTLFETYGDELAYVKQLPAAYIWTWIQGDDGEYVVSGFHFVNRIGYFVCEQPIPDGVHIEVPLETPDLEGRAIPSSPYLVPAPVIAAIDRIVGYFWHCEQTHLEECQEEAEPTESHIFHSLRVVRDWLQSYHSTTHA